MSYPRKIPHWINNEEYLSSDSGGNIPKYNPANGEIIAEISRGTESLVDSTITRAQVAFRDTWRKKGVMERAEILEQATKNIEHNMDDIANVLSVETGRSVSITVNEVREAVRHGRLWASEAMRFFGFTTESANPNRTMKVVRSPLGVCALLFPFNGPFGGLVKKLFPALLCGNAAIAKSHELTPYTSVMLGKILKDSGLPPDVYSVIQGDQEAGAAIVGDARVPLISFTGSAQVAKSISRTASSRLAKVSIETGGKNPLVVCDDANVEHAAEAAVSSAFVLSGQVCAAASRIIVFDAVYEAFRERMLEKTKAWSGIVPLMSEKAVTALVERVQEEISSSNATILVGGNRLASDSYASGYFMESTILENVSPEAEISRQELFGPVVCLYRVKDFDEALELANDTDFGLTAAIFTQSMDRAEVFTRYCEAGVVRVNGVTFGSEPHQVFGGVKLSGNGWREPGSKTLDVYSDWKVITHDTDPGKAV